MFETAVTRRGAFGAMLAMAGLGCGLFSAKPSEALAGSASLFDVIQPYESENWGPAQTTLMMAGDSYTGIEISYSSYAIYNLKGMYDSLKFTLGHIDGEDSGTLYIYLDNERFGKYDLDRSNLPFEIDVPLTGVMALKLCGGNWGGGGTGKLGLANPAISSSYISSNQAVPDGDYECEVGGADDKATVKVSIEGGAVTSLTIDSTSGTTSIEALAEALTSIIKTSSAPVAGESVSQALIAK